MSNLFCVIMAGGVGSRFWPLSRENKPKQFIDILGTGKSFLRQTYERFSAIIPDENFIVVTSERYKDLVVEQIPEIKPKQVLCEPMRRNTAPCIAYAAYRIAATNKDAMMVVAPSDHLITNELEFQRIIQIAVDSAQKNKTLMTIGIKPSRPECGYGYIQVDKNDAEEGEILNVKTFTEKPNEELANVFVKSGEFFWNSGMFVWSVETIIEALNRYTPGINKLFIRGIGAYNTQNEQQFINSIYPKCQNISIDYGIMEVADNASVICADFGWSDVGTWSALIENGRCLENEKQLLYQCENCVVRGDNSDKLIVVEGLKDYIIADSDDALLVIPLSKEQHIKDYIEDIKSNENLTKYL